MAIDKEKLNGRNRSSYDKDQDLYHEIVRNGLDLPASREPVDIQNNTKSGLDWKGMAVIGASAVAVMSLWQNGQPTPATQQPAQQPIIIQQPVQPAQQPDPVERTETITRVEELDLRIYDQDGNVISVSPWRGGDVLK